MRTLYICQKGNSGEEDSAYVRKKKVYAPSADKQTGIRPLFYGFWAQGGLLSTNHKEIASVIVIRGRGQHSQIKILMPLRRLLIEHNRKETLFLLSFPVNR